MCIHYRGPVPPPTLREDLEMFGRAPKTLIESIMPAVFTLSCGECDTEYTAVLYEQGDEPSLVVLPSDGRGIATTHTPPGVSYYLNQASRAHSVGANSAAITMFRSAVEWILEDQEYTEPMLGPKLRDLEKSISDKKAPLWVSQLHPDALKVLKDLGNTATHTNGGDLSKQDAIDADLYRAAEGSLLEILDIVYERPARSASHVAMMQRAISPKTATPKVGTPKP